MADALDGETDFYYDGWRVLEERNAVGTVNQQYVYGIYLDEPLVLDRNLNGDGSAIGPGDEPDGTERPHADAGAEADDRRQ